MPMNVRRLKISDKVDVRNERFHASMIAVNPRAVGTAAENTQDSHELYGTTSVCVNAAFCTRCGHWARRGSFDRTRSSSTWSQRRSVKLTSGHSRHRHTADVNEKTCGRHICPEQDRRASGRTQPYCDRKVPSTSTDRDDASQTQAIKSTHFEFILVFVY
jgi:hypothetical protein